jgi:hypothetical protein
MIGPEVPETMEFECALLASHRSLRHFSDRSSTLHEEVFHTFHATFTKPTTEGLLDSN